MQLGALVFAMGTQCQHAHAQEKDVVIDVWEEISDDLHFGHSCATS